MLSLNDIINVGFRKSGFSGYRTDDVDGFVDKVRESFEELQKRCTAGEERADKAEAQANENLEKLKVLAAKIEEYRAQEDEIKNALISAQKLGDASVREARHKAEIIVKDAELKANRIIDDADRKIVEQKREFDRLQKTVSEFRSKLLSVYKEHLTMIDALPNYKENAPEPAQAKMPEPQIHQQAPQPAAEQQPEPDLLPDDGDQPTEQQPAILNFED
jgi:cell division initiation protein